MCKIFIFILVWKLGKIRKRISLFRFSSRRFSKLIVRVSPLFEHSGDIIRNAEVRRSLRSEVTSDWLVGYEFRDRDPRVFRSRMVRARVRKRNERKERCRRSIRGGRIRRNRTVYRVLAQRSRTCRNARRYRECVHIRRELCQIADRVALFPHEWLLLLQYCFVDRFQTRACVLRPPAFWKFRWASTTTLPRHHACRVPSERKFEWRVSASCWMINTLCKINRITRREHTKYKENNTIVGYNEVPRLSNVYENWHFGLRTRFSSKNDKLWVECSEELKITLWYCNWWNILSFIAFHNL